MTNLVIMPTENRERMNLGEFAEEATIIEETATPKRVNHFIEANTQEATLQHLKNDCITPRFCKRQFVFFCNSRDFRSGMYIHFELEQCGILRII